MANQQLRDQVEDYKGRLHKNRRLKKISFAVALCLVAVTIVALVLPAVTLELGVPQCGKEEHTHTDACITQQLVCAKPTTPGHVHTNSCLDEAGAVACGQTAVAHMHIASCYDAQGRLVCGQEEDVHQHTAACIDANNTLACDTEDAVHVHGDTCYAVQDGGYVLVCQLPAAKGHVHSNVCLDVEGNVICGQEESLEATHVHDDSCYVEEITCGLEEHTHTELCYDEITQSIMKKDEESSAAEAADDAAETEDVVTSAEGDLTDEEIAEAADQGLLYENDAMIVTFDVPEDIKDKVVLNVTETDEPVANADAVADDESNDSEGDSGVSGQPVEGALPDATASNSDDANVGAGADANGDAGSEGVAPGLDPVPDAAGSNVADTSTDDDAAYATNLHIEATLDGKPVENIADLGITAKLQMKPSVIQPILAEISEPDVVEEAKADLGAEVTINQLSEDDESTPISERAKDETEAVVITSADEAAITFVLSSGNVGVTTSQTPNPLFRVQYYAYLDTLATTSNTQGLDDTNSLTVIDTSSQANGGEINLPTNGNLNLTTQRIGLVKDVTDGKYKLQEPEKKDLFQIYTDNDLKYHSAPNQSYFNGLADAKSYDLKEIWVAIAKEDDSVDGVLADYQNKFDQLLSLVDADGHKWLVFSDPTNVHFTNREETSAAQNYFLLEGNGDAYVEGSSPLIRMVYDTKQDETAGLAATFYDYDITDGSIYGSESDAQARKNAKDTSTQTDSKKAVANTIKQGINSDGNYSGQDDTIKYAFGNSVYNGVGGGPNADGAWQGNVFNRANNANFSGCTFQMVNATGLSANGPNFIGYDAPNIFGGDAVGKTEYGGYKLNFTKDGDTYTLTSVNNGTEDVLSDLGRFNSMSNWNNTRTLFSNEFWALDGVASHGTDGHDLKFGKDAVADNRKYVTATSGQSFNFPSADYNQDHNAYYGMTSEVEFELDKNYVGPLDYYFFGDDDMWVYLVEETIGDDGKPVEDLRSAKLVCDIGGVHGSVGEYVNLWDYVDKNAADTKTYKLKFYYTERGGSGSTCFMRFTLPSVTVIEPQDTGSVQIEKVVSAADGDEAALNKEEFNFKIDLYQADGINRLPDDYAYTRYDKNGNTVSSDLIIHTGGNFSLKNGEHVVIKYLPIGSTYTITELSGEDDASDMSVESGGYRPSYKYYVNFNPVETADGASFKGIIQKNDSDVFRKVEITNTKPYQLPATGGIGDHWFWVGGSALVLLALGAMWYRRLNAHTAAVLATGAAVSAGFDSFGASVTNVADASAANARVSAATKHDSPSGISESTYGKGAHRSRGDDALSRKGGN